MSMFTLSRPDLLNTFTSACPLHEHRRSLGRKATWSSSHGAGRLTRRVSCSHQNNGTGETQSSSLLLDRRDVLIALGGVYYGAAEKMAMAAPVMPPDLTKCHTAKAPGIVEPLKCCPPYKSADIVDYKFPSTPLRVRRAAQDVKDDKEYISKYNQAVKKMKELPKDHPWNYYQQALIHCAYCNDAYDQVGFPDVTLQVHNSWLFLPWHRYYLHFYERILGKLIGDDTFALPFWNFDSNDGMTFPDIYTDTSSQIYDEKRDETHYSPTILDYKYGYGNTGGSGLTGGALILSNLYAMKNTFNSDSLKKPELFMGDPVKAGEPEDSKSFGQLESIHNSIHQWVGPTTSPHLDMGNFSSAARDSVFFCLHSNVDRLWSLYRNLRGNRTEFYDNDWLDSTFIFYDEDQQVARVKVRDCLNSKKLRYIYDEVPVPWLGKLPRKKPTETKEKIKKELFVPVKEFGPTPRALESTIRVIVPRPTKQRKKAEKAEEVEVLFVKDIDVTNNGPARFDVYIAPTYGDLAGPDYGEFAGSFVTLPHSVMGKMKGKARKVYLKLGITSLLEDLDAEDADKLVLTLVPRVGEVTVGGVAIKLLQTDNPVAF